MLEFPERIAAKHDYLYNYRTNCIGRITLPALFHSMDPAHQLSPITRKMEVCMADSNETLSDYPIPPANFAFLVESVLMQAQIQLGLLHLDPEDQDREPNLPMARHSIDMLAMLQEKTKGNLSIEEKRLIENGLTELRVSLRSSSG